jgi:hypothetical protein
LLVRPALVDSACVVVNVSDEVGDADVLKVFDEVTAIVGADWVCVELFGGEEELVDTVVLELVFGWLPPLSLRNTKVAVAARKASRIKDSATRYFLRRFMDLRYRFGIYVDKLAMLLRDTAEI